jgi:hypothetical protein
MYCPTLIQNPCKERMLLTMRYPHSLHSKRATRREGGGGGRETERQRKRERERERERESERERQRET